MLLQSHENEIVLLPALPSNWRTGSVRGLRARGGFELDFAWTDGALTSVTVRSHRSTRTTLRVGDKTAPIALGTGTAGTWDGNLKPVAN
jgi:alpha-L-fucosidase 2